MTRPKSRPTKKMNPMNDMMSIMKYFREGDATTVSYKSDKLSACGATCGRTRLINLVTKPIIQLTTAALLNISIRCCSFSLQSSSRALDFVSSFKII